MILRRLYSLINWLNQKGFYDLLVVRFFTQFLGFGSVLFVAKFLTPVELGEVKIIQSYVAVFSLVAGFGFNTSLLKVCSENRPDQEKHGILRYSLNLSAITTLLTLILVVIMALTGIVSSSPKLSSWMIVYALVIPLDVITNIFIVFLLAQKKIKEMARFQAIVKIQSVILIVISTWAWGFKGFIFATIASYGVGLWPFLRQIGTNFLHTRLEKKPDHFLQYAIFSVLANGVSLIGQRSDIFILDHFYSNREAIGYYSLALTFVLVANQVTNTVQSIVTPYFSEHAQDEIWFKKQLFINQLRMSLLSAVVAVGVYGLAYILVPLVFGPQYIPTLTYLSVLLIGYVVWSSYAIIGPSMLGLGLMHYNFIIVAISTPVGLLLSYSLLQRLGIIGVAWAQVGSGLVSLILVLIANTIALKRTFRKSPH